MVVQQPRLAHAFWVACVSNVELSAPLPEVGVGGHEQRPVPHRGGRPGPAVVGGVDGQGVLKVPVAAQKNTIVANAKHGGVVSLLQQATRQSQPTRKAFGGLLVRLFGACFVSWSPLRCSPLFPAHAAGRSYFLEMLVIHEGVVALNSTVWARSMST